jgi:hypothetical protein
MRTTARITAAILSTTIVVGSATSAVAETATVKDRASDVVAYANETDETGVVLGYADSIASGADIRSLKVDHAKKKVTVTLRFAELKSGVYVSVAFRPSGKSQPSRFLVNTGHKSGEVYDQKDKARCAVPLTTKLGKGGTIKATVKRSCLGDPKKIKAFASSYRYGSNGSVQVDTTSTSSVDYPSYTKWLKAS